MNDNYIDILRKRTDIEKVYKSIVQKYSGKENALEKTDSKIIKEIIEKNGYSCSYNKSEKFYKVILTDGKYKIGYNILIRYGVVDFVLFIFNDEECIGGESIDWLLLDEEERREYELPGFSTYEELEEILLPMFEVIETFEPEKIFDQIE